jgi:tetratricopeptide (TPR) repeat protein
VSSLLIEEGLAALHDGDAATARRAFELALAEAESAQALEGLAEALYLEREYAASAAHYERAYSAYRRERQTMAAGRAARTIAWITGNVLGDWAVRSGWLARARTLLEEAGEDRPEHGWVQIIKAFSEPDAQVREALLREAIKVGRRFGDPDIEFLALAYLGGLFVMTDRVEEGLVLSDEALAAASAGELTELATVDEIFCGLLWACELVTDVPRADQWMRAAADRMQRSNVVAAFCRAHYGGILTAAGRWTQAETELVEAARHFDQGMSARRAAAMIRLADLRVRQGRLEEATQLLQGLEQHPDAVRTLAALHLARGDTALARDLLERATQGADAEVPTVGESTMVGPLLALLVDVHLEEGNVDDAARVARRLGRVAHAQRGRISGPPPRWRRGGCASPVERETRAPACTRRWRGSRGPSCRWSWPGRVWSWRGRSRNARPRSPSPKRNRHSWASSGYRPPGTPTPPRRCCGRWAHPSGPAPRRWAG